MREKTTRQSKEEKDRSMKSVYNKNKIYGIVKIITIKNK